MKLKSVPACPTCGATAKDLERRLAALFHGERIASAGGPTYEYATAAKDSVDASRVAKAASASSARCSAQRQQRSGGSSARSP